MVLAGSTTKVMGILNYIKFSWQLEVCRHSREWPKSTHRLSSGGGSFTGLWSWLQHWKFQNAIINSNQDTSVDVPDAKLANLSVRLEIKNVRHGCDTIIIFSFWFCVWRPVFSFFWFKSLRAAGRTLRPSVAQLTWVKHVTSHNNYVVSNLTNKFACSMQASKIAPTSILRSVRTWRNLGRAVHWSKHCWGVYPQTHIEIHNVGATGGRNSLSKIRILIMSSWVSVEILGTQRTARHGQNSEGARVTELPNVYVSIE